MSGGQEEEEEEVDAVDDGKAFYYQKCYFSDSARFEDVPEQFTKPLDFCVACQSKREKEAVSNNYNARDRNQPASQPAIKYNGSMVIFTVE